jgi:hypothetical protein
LVIFYTSGVPGTVLRFFYAMRSNIILPLQSNFIGEVSEWSKEHAWKVCIRQKCIEGSNPSLSAHFGIKTKQKPANQMIAGFCILIETPINTPFPDKKGRD